MKYYVDQRLLCLVNWTKGQMYLHHGNNVGGYPLQICQYVPMCIESKVIFGTEAAA